MALGAHQGPHLLVTRLLDVPSHPLPRLHEGGASDGEAHVLGTVAVLAPDRVGHLVPQVAPGVLVESGDPILIHEAGDVGALAGEAGGGLIDVGAEGPVEVLDGIIVSPNLIVVPGEGVPGPQDHHLRVLGQHVPVAGPPPPGNEGGVQGLEVGLEVTGELLPQTAFRGSNSGSGRMGTPAVTPSDRRSMMEAPRRPTTKTTTTVERKRIQATPGFLAASSAMFMA
jgi:hypothetical protein